MEKTIKEKNIKMKTAEQIYQENGCNSKNDILEAMKEYAKQFIVETVEICNCHSDDGCFDKDGALANSLNLIK